MTVGDDSKILALKEKIEELEKTVNFHGGINMRFDEFGKYLTKMNKELKNLIQSNAISDLNHYEVATTNIQINRSNIAELKQEVGAYRNYQNNCGYTTKLDEVLQELINAITENPFKKILFAKLDSGGEKELDWARDLYEKPPEPKCEDCRNEVFCSISGDSRRFCKKHDFENFRPKNEKTDVRDALMHSLYPMVKDFTDYRLVKREDLKRWKDIFDLPYAEFVVPEPDGRFESDYIKEEYQIE